MTQTPTRITLTSTGFPFLSNKQGRTVIIPGIDTTGPGTGQADQNLALPEIYYGHNIIPTAQGFQSVAYRDLTAPPADTDGTFLQVLVLRDSAGNKAYLGVTLSGRNYILKDYLGGWIRTTDVAPAVAGGLVTVAYINGVTYIYYAGTGCYYYNFSTNVLTAQVLTALTAADILGIVASNGYLLAFKLTYIYWSSTVTPTDFTPSLATGAGGSAIQELKGTIVIALEHTIGFIIYSTYNIVVAAYTGNIRFPFKFKEIVGSGGMIDDRHVDIDPVSGDHYAYTTSGIQLVTAQVTNSVMPDLTDFLAGLAYEDFDDTTNTFTNTLLTSQMSKRVTSISDRYIVFSYGTTTGIFTYCTIYDIALRRFGKLKITHVDCFEYVLLGATEVDNAKNSIGFLKADGAVVIASLSANTAYSVGVILLGKFQLVRQRLANLYQVAVENVRQDANFSCTDLVSLNGKTTTSTIVGYLHASTSLSRDYRFKTTGINHSLLFKGAFDLVSIVVDFGLGGYR